MPTVGGWRDREGSRLQVQSPWVRLCGVTPGRPAAQGRAWIRLRCPDGEGVLLEVRSHHGYPGRKICPGLRGARGENLRSNAAAVGDTPTSPHPEPLRPPPPPGPRDSRGWLRRAPRVHTASTRARRAPRVTAPRPGRARVTAAPARTHLAGLGLGLSIQIRPHRHLGSDRAVRRPGPLTPPGRAARPAPGPPPASPASGRGPRRGPQRRREPDRDAEAWRATERDGHRAGDGGTDRWRDGEKGTDRDSERDVGDTETWTPGIPKPPHSLPLSPCLAPASARSLHQHPQSPHVRTCSQACTGVPKPATPMPHAALWEPAVLLPLDSTHAPGALPPAAASSSRKTSSLNKPHRTLVLLLSLRPPLSANLTIPLGCCPWPVYLLQIELDRVSSTPDLKEIPCLGQWVGG